ncbi:MAG: hypothetical protein C0424_01015 [Sphingobacteriaceae bacterium]|nr:hypothetical protein [Sphingobacteriaceae bacterium]
MRLLISVAIAWLFLSSCERVIQLEMPEKKEYVVVHGHIEPDSFAYVSLSRNSPYFAPVDLQTVAGLLINGALVTVEADGLIDTMRADFNFQHWTLFNYRGTKIKGEAGKTYRLRIQTSEVDLEASTTIPMVLPLDSLWHRTRADFVREAGQFQPTARDSQLVNLYFRYADPLQKGNYVRAFTKRQGELQWSSDFNSIYSDDLVNGQSVDFILRRGKEAYLFADSSSFSEFGYFEKGDTISVKWCAIDRPHYLFWLTLNSATGGSGNPFSTPTVVSTNIRARKGRGLGIWGGYGSVVYQYIP